MNVQSLWDAQGKREVCLDIASVASLTSRSLSVKWAMLSANFTCRAQIKTSETVGSIVTVVFVNLVMSGQSIGWIHLRTTTVVPYEVIVLACHQKRFWEDLKYVKFQWSMMMVTGCLVLSYPWHSKYYSGPLGTSPLMIERSLALSHPISITWPSDLISVSPSPLYTLITICFVLY